MAWACDIGISRRPRSEERGAHIHKEAWRGDYELDGRRVSEMTPLCALYFPLRLIFALGLLTIGIMDWAMARDARR